MRIDSVKMHDYSRNKNNSSINFGVSLPKVGAIPVLYDGWDRVFLTCQKQDKLPELQNILTKLRDAGKGVLCCVWKRHDDYPTFYSAKNSEELTTKIKPILDSYKSKDTVSFISMAHKSKNIVAETYDVRMNSQVESNVLFSNVVNKKDKESDSILKVLDDIATQGSVKNKVLFSTEADEFYIYFRE